MAEPGLLSGLFSRGAVADEVSDLALLKAMLDVELALSRALVHAGLAPPEAAEELSQAVLDPSTFDLGELGRATGEQGTPVSGLLSVLRARLSDEAAAYLHIGATSQDVVDTAVMLVAKRALNRCSETSLTQLTRARRSSKRTGTLSCPGALCSSTRSR